MKAAYNAEYGAPRDVIEVKDIPKPIPKNNEVLIKVYATTVNRTDEGFLRGKPFIVRFFSGLPKPKAKVKGNEFAGQVETVGKAVTQYKTGDKVFGYNEGPFGAHAEYTVMKEDGNMAIIPEGWSYEEAAPLTEGAHYALSDIRAAKIQAGQNWLINGATGAIGSAAVQIVKHFGARVTAVCATPHIELVKGLGADVVKDYTKEDFTQTEERYDVIFDAVGKSEWKKCKSILKDKGIYMSTELGPGNQNPFLAIMTGFGGGKRVLFPIPTINKKDVEFFKELAEKGAFKPVIDKYYPLDEIVAAYEYVLSGMKTGNVVIRVSA